MSTMPQTPQPPQLTKPTRFGERLIDAHNHSVDAGWQGPIVGLIAFVSSTLVLTFRGARWCVQRCRGLRQ